MPHVTNTYRRVDLYERVWSRPMREVAKEYGISDVALAKVCRRLNVPTPPRGFWARKAAGHEVPVTSLPALKDGEEAEYTVRKWVYPAPTPPSAEEVAFRARPEFLPKRVEIPFKIEVAPTLERPHGLVAAAKKGLLKVQPDHNGLCWPGIPDSFELKVGAAQADRTFRILDALLKGIEKAGHKVTLVGPNGYQKRVAFIVDGEEVHFSIRERVVKSDKPFSPEDARWSFRDRHFRPAGDLRFKISYENPYSVTQEWCDSPKKSLEAQANDIFEAILRVAPMLKASRAERTERSRLQAIEAEQERQAQLARRRDEEWGRALVDQSQQWERAQVLRRFIEAVRAEMSQAADVTLGSQAEQWLLRASAVAERLDPIPELAARASLDGLKEQGEEDDD